MQTNRIILKEKVDPKVIAKEFIIGELIKMFPQADDEFYDKIRFYVRETMDQYPENRFWNLVAGISENFMVKSLHRMLRGDEFFWSLEEIPLDLLEVRMIQVGSLGDVLRKADYNAAKAGEILRSMDSSERLSMLAPFKFEKDTYPVIAHEEGDSIMLHDGNRRTLNFAVYGSSTIKAYVGRINPHGKPAIDEGFFATLTKIIKDETHVHTYLVESVAEILMKAKTNYINGQKLAEQYAKENIYPLLKRAEHKRIIEKVFEEEKDEAVSKTNDTNSKKNPNLYIRKFPATKEEFLETLKDIE